jgi:hypothetical protein
MVFIMTLCTSQRYVTQVDPSLFRHLTDDVLLTVSQREYSLVFDELKGEDVALCLPKASVPNAGLKDFTSCRA